MGGRTRFGGGSGGGPEEDRGGSDKNLRRQAAENATAHGGIMLYPDADHKDCLWDFGLAAVSRPVGRAISPAGVYR